MIFFVLISLVVLQNIETKQVFVPENVTGMVEGKASIKCMYFTYPEANKIARKFLCREEKRKGCITMISRKDSEQKEFVAESFSGRASLKDDKDKGIITIELTQLQRSDEGIYRCGIGVVNDDLNAMFNLTVTKDPPPSNSKEPDIVLGQMRNTMTLMCDMKEQSSTMKPYLCKKGNDGCRRIIDNTGNVPDNYQGRVILNKGQTEGSFSVKFVQLKSEDAGAYVCGFEFQGEHQESKVYKVYINEETDIPIGSRVLTANIGGSVAARCNYNPNIHYKLKSWCQWGSTGCDPLMNTVGTVQDTYTGRIVFHDNKEDGSMQVLMNQMTEEDEGWYWCVMTDGHNEQITVVQVKIKDDKRIGLAGTKTFSVPAGQSVRMPCFYPCKYYDIQKYWCKWTKLTCEPLTTKDGDDPELSVTCDNRELVLTINAAKSEDEGWYVCGVNKDGKYGETIAVHLSVEEPKENESSLRSINGQNNKKGDFRNSAVDNTQISSENNNSSTILAVVLSICASVLVVLAVFFTIKLMKRRNTDLVSVGSYRTNISMTDLDNGSYLGKDNPSVIGSQETNIGQNPEGPKPNKKGSQEALEYSTFLIQHTGKPDDDVTS